MKYVSLILLPLVFALSSGCKKVTLVKQAVEQAIVRDTTYIRDTVLPSYDTVMLYLLAGQSNCGRPHYPGDGSTGAAATPGQHLLYDSAIRGFQIYNPIYDSAHFHDIQAGVNTYLINYITTDEMGPEVSFMKAMHDSSGLKEAYLIKYGIGNTALANYWLAGGQYGLYYYFSKGIQLLLSRHKIPVFKGFIWMQGENDATDSTWATQYEHNLALFVNQFNSMYQDVCNASAIPYNDYKFVIGRINGAQDPTEVYRNLVRLNEENYVLVNKQNSVWINTDNYPLFGGVHYTVTGQIQFGKDIYEQLK